MKYNWKSSQLAEKITSLKLEMQVSCEYIFVRLSSKSSNVFVVVVFCALGLFMHCFTVYFMNH
jgi:hypothetical protein